MLSQALCIIHSHQWSKLELQSINTKVGSKWVFFLSCVTLKFNGWAWQNRAPLPCYSKICASFHNHLWIQNRVRPEMPKLGQNLLTSVTFTFDLWLRPFAWTSLLSMVILHRLLFIVITLNSAFLNNLVKYRSCIHPQNELRCNLPREYKWEASFSAHQGLGYASACILCIS